MYTCVRVCGNCDILFGWKVVEYLVKYCQIMDLANVISYEISITNFKNSETIEIPCAEMWLRVILFVN